MLVRLIAFHFCFIGLIALAGAAPLPFETVFKGRSQFDRLVVQARANNWASLPIGDRTAAVGRALVGTRYKSFTLEIDNHVEAPSVNFYGMDCWTFFEISLGFARMLNDSPNEWSPARLLPSPPWCAGRPLTPPSLAVGISTANRQTTGRGLGNQVPGG